MIWPNEDSRKRFFSTKEEAWRRATSLLVPVMGATGLSLRRWRRDHGLSQAALAVLLGVSLRSIIRWEKLERLPQLVAILVNLVK